MLRVARYGTLSRRDECLYEQVLGLLDQEAEPVNSIPFVDPALGQ